MTIEQVYPALYITSTPNPTCFSRPPNDTSFITIWMTERCAVCKNSNLCTYCAHTVYNVHCTYWINWKQHALHLCTFALIGRSNQMPVGRNRMVEMNRMVEGQSGKNDADDDRIRIGRAGITKKMNPDASHRERDGRMSKHNVSWMSQRRRVPFLVLDFSDAGSLRRVCQASGEMCISRAYPSLHLSHLHC